MATLKYRDPADGVWKVLPIAGVSVVSPAQAGPRSDDATAARFGNNGDASGRTGFTAYASGLLQANSGNGQSLIFYERDAAGTGYTALFRIDSTGVRVYPAQGGGGLRLGQSPQFGSSFVWIGVDAGAANSGYALLHSTDATYTYLNALTTVALRIGNVDRLIISNNDCSMTAPRDLYLNGVNNFALQKNGSTYIGSSGNDVVYNIPGWHYFRIGGADKVVIDPGGTNLKNRLGVNSPSADGTWGQAMAVFTGLDGQRISLNSPGVAPQLRATQAEGDTLCCINNPNSGYSPFKGTAYITVSSLTFKKDVQTFGRERERITVRDWQSDTVPRDLSIMDLRPVTFRPKVPQYRVAEDGTSVERDPSTILGRQGLREHLGLVAEEVATVIPSAVIFNDLGEDPGIDYTQVTVALLEHVQRLTDEVATLRYRIAELEKT